MKYGLIGDRLGHSFSKEIHERLADYIYDLKELSSPELDAFMRKKDFSAINVTIPYKQSVMPYLDEISEQAQNIGAVNTVVRKGNKLYGYNTDFLGMRALILRSGIVFTDKKVLILGGGGTSRTAQAVAKDLKAKEIYVVSRLGREGISYSEARDFHSDAQIIINTTPCGMYPHIDELPPIELDDFPALEGVVDAIYNPLRTKLVSVALERGIPAVGGLYMLVAQAGFAVEYFLDKRINQTAIEAVYSDLCSQKENIVLIGMPGCGKSTIGRMLSKKLNRSLKDSDDLIKERFDATPDQIIRKHGEKVFRDMESMVITERIAPLNGQIISTGGGAILRDENVRALKMNGKMVFLDRPLELLAVSSDRPLSSDRTLLEKRYRERYGRYCEIADIRISADKTPAEICKEIIEELRK